MIMQAPSIDIGSSPTSVHQEFMSELDGKEPQTTHHQSSQKEVISATSTTTIYRRSSQESSSLLNTSGPLFYENDDTEMKRPHMDRTSSVQLPPRYAEAEKEKIFCLKRECKALNMAMRALPKHSKEWTMMNARLDIAKDELQATLEDMDMTQHFAHDEAIDVGEESASSPIFVPTPPLSSPVVQKTPIKSFSKNYSSPDSETDSITEINEVRQKTKSKPKKVNVDALKQKMDRAEKFSLEYFKIKKKLDAATNATSLTIEHSNSSGTLSSSSSGSTESLGPPPSLQSCEGTTFGDTFDTSSTGPPQSLKSFEGTPSPAPPIKKTFEVRESRQRVIPPPPQLAIPEKLTTASPQAPLQPIRTVATPPSPVTTQQQSIKLGNGLGDLKELLDVVPKYSLEWFKLKNEIKEASGGGHTNNTSKRPTRQLFKHRSSVTIGATNNEVATLEHNQFQRLDSSQNQYPIPHVTKSRNAERRRSSSVRPTSSTSSRRSRRTRAFSKERSKEGSKSSFDSLDAQYLYVRMRRNVVTVQSIWRGRVAQLNFMRFKSAALCIQSTFRMTLRRNLYKQVLYGLTFIQACWRGHAQRLNNTAPVQEIVLQPIAQGTAVVHKQTATNKSSSDEEDFSRIQRSIEAMKNEKMSMEQKVLQLKNDIEAIKNEKLRKQLDLMKQEIETLEHHNEDVLHEQTASSSVFSSDQTLASVPSNTYSVVLEQQGPLGIEMEHHKTSDTVRVAHVKKRSQAEKAGLCQGDIVVNFRSRKYPDGMNYAQFIALAKQGVRPLVLDITRVDPSVVGSSRRSGFFRKKKLR